MRAAYAGARSSLSPLSTPPRQPTPGLLRTRSSPSRLNSTHISPDVDSEVAPYPAPSFELSTKTDSSIASNAKPSGTATKTKAPVRTTKDFVKPPASAVTASQRNSIYGKAFELLDDGTLVESVIDPFGSLSLNGNAALQSSSKGKGKEVEEVATVSGFEPTISRVKPRIEHKPKRATSTPALTSVPEPKPVHPFPLRAQSAPDSQVPKPPTQLNEATMPKAPVLQKFSATSLGPQPPRVEKSSKSFKAAPANDGSAGPGRVRKGRSRSQSKSPSSETPRGVLGDANSATVEPQSDKEPKLKSTSHRSGRAKASRTKKLVADPNLPTYTYKDPEFALAYAQPEKSTDSAEEEPKKMPIEPARWYITSADEANDALAGLKGPLGFDMEWVFELRRGAIPRKTALIQIADRTKIMLFQVTRMSEVIENPDIIMTGVNITGDARKLFKDWGVQAQGIVELAMMAWEVDRPTMESHGLKTGWTTLANMVSMYLGRVLPKGAERTSNWEKPLDELQLEYAANDAHCGLVIYKKLLAKAEAAEIDLSTLRLNRLDGPETTTTEPKDLAESDRGKDAEDAYAELVLAATAVAEPQSTTASATSVDTKPVAPPCPSGVEYYRYRAYRLWYERPELTLDEICLRLRSEKPLARKTVIGYVVTTLEADTEKTLPFSKDRLIRLVREEPDSWQWHYKWIIGLSSN
ncbi:hypothetical protein FRC04_009761 [Tulasnella sp. 424]|nr:hypothetical protein FRC04_009761 [Tulasnella sp. 424]